MIFVGLETQWCITQRVVVTTRPLDRCWTHTSLPNFLSSSINKIQPFSKKTSVRLEPQWHITQPVVFTTRPLAR